MEDDDARALIYGLRPFAPSAALRRRDDRARLDDDGTAKRWKTRAEATRERARAMTRGRNAAFAASASEGEAPGMKFAKDVFAGTCGGITVTLLGHPFDTVKVLLQTQSSKNPVYSGAVDAASKVIKAEGVGGLYRGVTSPLAGQMFFRATLFFAYARAKEFVGDVSGGPAELREGGRDGVDGGDVL